MIRTTVRIASLAMLVSCGEMNSFRTTPTNSGALNFGWSDATESELRLSQPAGTAVAAELQDLVDDLERKISHNKTNKDNRYTVTLRDFTNGALAAILLGGATNATRAQLFLSLALPMQDLSTSSANFGSFPWSCIPFKYPAPSGAKPQYCVIANNTDNNATAFTTQAFASIWYRSCAQTRKTFCTALEKSMSAAAQHLMKLVNEGIKKPSYTNMYLMISSNLITMGEALGDDAISSKGYSHLNTWIKYLRGVEGDPDFPAHGIREYTSPTYYGVDLNSLSNLYLWASKPTSPKAILDYFWVDIKANSLAKKMAGSRSRDYDFLGDPGESGTLYIWWFLEGLFAMTADDLHEIINLEQVYAYQNFLGSSESGGYHLLRGWDSVAGPAFATANRETIKIFDSAPNSDLYNFLTPHFALGSASQNYGVTSYTGPHGDKFFGTQDKLINFAVNTPKEKFVNVTIVPDQMNNPYGTEKSGDLTGHSKAVHLKLNPGSAQSQGALLTMLNLDPSEAGTVDNLATNILLPNNADKTILFRSATDKVGTLLDLKVTNNAQRPAPTFTTASYLAMREAKACIVLRIFHNDSLGGIAPRMVVQADELGNELNAGRMTIYHYEGSAKKFDQSQLKIAVFAFARVCESEAALFELIADVKNIDLAKEILPDTFSVHATLDDGTTMSVQRSRSDGVLVSRELNGEAVGMLPSNTVMLINGRDYLPKVPLVK